MAYIQMIVCLVLESSPSAIIQGFNSLRKVSGEIEMLWGKATS